MSNPANNVAPSLFRPTDTGLQLALFAVSFGIAWVLNWQLSDLVWGLWIASLVVGYSLIICSIKKQAQRRTRARRSIAGRFGRALFLLAFFTVHFGGFHFVQGLILLGFFPIVPREDWPLAAIVPLLIAYWPFVLASFIQRWPDIRATWMSGKADDKTGPALAYTNVIRMHLLIFLLAILQNVSISQAPLYLLVYGLFFFPFKPIYRWWKERQHASPG